MRSLEVRKHNSSRHEREIWTAIWFVGYYLELRTLRQFANALNQLGLCTSLGKKWTEGTVSHVFRTFGSSAKQLHNQVTMPPARSPPPALTPHQMASERKRLDMLYAAYVANGKWHQAVLMAPRKAEPVRHDHFGEGQFISELGRGRLRCRFLDEDGTFDISLKATEVEFFRYRKPQ